MNTKKRELGIHLRIDQSYSGVLEHAHRLGISSCQFFFIHQQSDRYLRLTKKEKETFLALRHKHFSTLYAHCSYWINSASGNKVSADVSQVLLKKEISMAKQLDIEYLVMHAGTAKGFPNNPDDTSHRQEGLHAIANLLNKALKIDDTVTVLLENTAHGNKTVGSDFCDFAQLRPLLKYPEKIGFCVDTSHAFAYGYNLEATNTFVELLDQTIGLTNIKLIHLNDSKKPCGSRIDNHAIPGKGLIGEKVLKQFINHKKLKHIPLIIEPPLLNDEELVLMYKNVITWLF